MNKKGVSNVISMVLIIALIFVVIGAVWMVISQIIFSRTDEANDYRACMDIGLEVVQVSEDCGTNTGCNVTIRRTAGGGNMSGVKLVFSDEFISSAPYDEEVSIGARETYKVEVYKDDGGVGIPNPTIVEATPYVVVSGNVEVLCKTTSKEIL